MKTIILSLCLTIALFSSVHKGDTFPDISFTDQFGNKINIPIKGKHTILISFEKDVSYGVNKFLQKKPKKFIKDNHIHYISDVSHAPSILFKMFALPKLKKLPFSVALIYEEEGKYFPQKKGKVTIISIKDNNITNIQFEIPTNIPLK